MWWEQRKANSENPTSTFRQLEEFDVRLLLVGVVAVGAACAAYANDEKLGDFARIFVSTIAAVVFLYDCVKHREKHVFAHDLLELAVIESVLMLTSFGLWTWLRLDMPGGDRVYSALEQIRMPWNAVTFSMIAARLTWFAKNADGEYVRWPVFGPVSIIRKIQGKTNPNEPSNDQTLSAYLLILFSLSVAFVLTAYEVKKTGILAILVCCIFLCRFSISLRLKKVAQAEEAHLSKIQEEIAKHSEILREAEARAARQLLAEQRRAMQANMELQSDMKARIDELEEEIAEKNGDTHFMAGRLRELRAEADELRAKIATLEEQRAIFEEALCGDKDLDRIEIYGMIDKMPDAEREMLLAQLRRQEQRRESIEFVSERKFIIKANGGKE